MTGSLLDVVWEELPKLVAGGRPLSECMSEMASLCNEIEPDQNWAQFESIEYDASIEPLQLWLHDNIRQSPPSFALDELYFMDAELSRPGVGSHYSIDMHGTGPASDEHRLMWKPAEQYVHPPALIELSRISSGSADYVMPLTFMAVAVRAMLDPYTSFLFGSDADDIGVIVGWHDGDYYEIGQFTKTGFRGDPRNPFPD